MPELTITAPEGAHFEWEEVKTDKGQTSLGEHPILVWDSSAAALAHYGEEGVLNIFDGTSVRVSMQSIARRYAIAKKSDDEIAKAMVEFKPGSRQGGKSTPASRAASAARKASEKVGDSDVLTKFLEKLARGEISQEDLEAIAQ